MLRTSRELVAKVLNIFFRQNMSQDCRVTVVQQSYDVHASVANMSPRNFGEFTMRKFRDSRTIVARMQYNSRATVVRMKTKLKLRSWERRITISRMSRDCIRQSRDYRATIPRYIFKIRPKIANLSHKVHSRRLRCESFVNIVDLCREIVSN